MGNVKPLRIVRNPEQYFELLDTRIEAKAHPRLITEVG